MTRTVTIIFGISGAGKTTACIDFVERHPDYCHIRASSLLEGFQRWDRSLNAIEVDQTRILSAFNRLKILETRNILFDAHSIIRSDAGLFMVPTAIIKALSPNLLVLLDVDADTAERRRVARNPANGVLRNEDICQERNFAREACEAYSRELRVPLLTAVVAEGFRLDELLLRKPA
ncbi:hypothetical protein ELI02_10985 [Rhizobium leguminosarum]|uniref:AAA family ATPase n=1 Tax=Rhizobium leguminosarum TaxID=384 RepID=UPI001030F0A9|nr:hypothetical protein ELI32_13505 [Rhizobium leguminosarum]TAV58487.1 hypothetical protein ELI31_12025 [Rhizobium leguminosarum]TAV69536.1 hypothetical protein ELI30_12810 [Rhizobium leguminosarum]TAX55992.1 hypothetical protein ELI01_12540 [Rhizobium leguminosarum]TAX60498.1 hypothetical protein ELI02_10985 [Rhizobium leguminosarum]